MLPPKSIQEVWKKFDRFPMETVTKMWWFHTPSQKKQRDVSLMREHRDQYGLSGNCFDLALWLLEEFNRAGVTAYPVGHHLKTKDAHVAVIAVDEAGRRYLCDLGDQWLQPILVDISYEDFSEDKLRGFFPAADIQVKVYDSNDVEIFYHRPNGKVSSQMYDLRKIDNSVFLQAAEHSQHLLKRTPLVEGRIPYKDEVAHWEFSHWKAFMSTSEGLFREPVTSSIADWAALIHEKTGLNEAITRDSLEKYTGRLQTNRL